jgi:hypothetical protein
MENNPNSFEPTNPIDPNLQEQSTPERGGCLTALLVLMMIGNGIGIIIYLAMGHDIARKAHIPEYSMYLMSFFAILNIIFAYLIWNWKKAGVIGLCVNAGIILIVNLALGLGASSFGGLVGVAILIALVSPHWKHFK